jgi:hypothetical protein
MNGEKWRYQDSNVDYENEYAHYYLCRNCNNKIYVFIKKGCLIKDIAVYVICDNCGIFQK